MRFALAILVWATVWLALPAWGDEPFIVVVNDDISSYIVPESYAEAHQDEVLASIPGGLKIDGFWTPTEQHVLVAERVFRELLEDGVKDATVVFPDLSPDADDSSPESAAYQQEELALVLQNYHRYTRQYLGLLVDGKKIVLCNYADVPKVDSATDFLFLEKYFEPGEKTHFLLGRVDPRAKTCANVSLIGSWR